NGRKQRFELPPLRPLARQPADFKRTAVELVRRQDRAHVRIRMDLVEKQRPYAHSDDRGADQERRAAADEDGDEGERQAGITALGEVDEVGGRIERRAVVVLAELLRDGAEDRHFVGENIIEPEMGEPGEKVADESADEKGREREPYAGAVVQRHP